ncbi:radical SAM protein [Paenibacillus tengchongensis]|uniref:radical SAM protein n=1 Tax=Paenibacillus tengchongensis TaxID=2608684 RepID=UPI00124DD1C3|nr:radical SAM protein [Paenibacillus tengchongensis]
MTYNYTAHKEIRAELRSKLKDLRETAKRETKRDINEQKKVIFTEVRKGYINNTYVERLVVFLRGTGCSLVKETGGCTFCGFYNATNFGVKIADEDYISQIKEVIEDAKVNFHQYPIICLYNDGSMLREEEISIDGLIAIIKILSEQDTVKKIVIEGRVEDVSGQKLAKIRAATHKELEIAVGFESANPLIRDLCINKNFDNAVFEENCFRARSHGISIIPLLMIKPPFLTEKEAVEDYIDSLVFLEKFKFQRIDMELPTVEANTLVHELWKRGEYKPISFWSVIKILKARQLLELKTPLYISPPNYSVSAIDRTSNCDVCDPLIFEAIDKFNTFGEIYAFESIECSCKAGWERKIKEEVKDADISKRVEASLRAFSQEEDSAAKEDIMIK